MPHHPIYLKRCRAYRRGFPGPVPVHFPHFIIPKESP